LYCKDPLQPHIFLEWLGEGTGVCSILDAVKGEELVVYASQLKKVE
jgi:hypothetical protein